MSHIPPRRVSKILASKCRHQPLPVVECDVVMARWQDAQWRVPLDGASTLARMVIDYNIPPVGYLGIGSLRNVTQLHSLVKW